MIQATLGFATDSGQRTGAWDEIYYTNHTTPQQALEAWTGQGAVNGPLGPRSPLSQRIAALSNQCYSYYARFNDPDSKSTKSLVWQPFQGKILGGLTSDNMAGDSANMRVLADGGFGREVRIGGVPDTMISGGVVDPGYINQYIGDIGGGVIPPNNTNTFLAAWRSIGGVIRVRNSTIGGPQSWPVLSYSKPTQYGTITATLDMTNGNPDLTIGYAMSIRGQPQMRGTWKLAATAVVGAYTLLGSEKVSVPSVVRSFLTARVFGGSVPTTLKGLYASALKLGKKKFQYVGRRSPVLIRH